MSKPEKKKYSWRKMLCVKYKDKSVLSRLNDLFFLELNQWKCASLIYLGKTLLLPNGVLIFKVIIQNAGSDTRQHS